MDWQAVITSVVVHEGWEFVHGDGVVSETEDTGHGGGKEGSSLDGGDFSE